MLVKAVVPSLFGTRDWFHARQFFHGRGGGGAGNSSGVNANASDGGDGSVNDGSGGNASDGERQMKFHSLASRSPPAVRPGS